MKILKEQVFKVFELIDQLPPQELDLVMGYIKGRMAGSKKQPKRPAKQKNTIEEMVKNNMLFGSFAKTEVEETFVYVVNPKVNDQVIFLHKILDDSYVAQYKNPHLPITEKHSFPACKSLPAAVLSLINILRDSVEIGREWRKDKKEEIANLEKALEFVKSIKF